MADLPTTKWLSVSDAEFFRGARINFFTEVPVPSAPMTLGDAEELVLDVGDLAPPFGFVLRDQDGGAMDLATGSPAATFSMWPAEGGAAVVTDLPAAIVDAATGLVRVDLPLEATEVGGSFLGKFKLVQNSLPSHHPVNRSIVVRILKVAP